MNTAIREAGIFSSFFGHTIRTRRLPSYSKVWYNTIDALNRHHGAEKDCILQERLVY